MSRIGNKPVSVLEGVKVALVNGAFSAEGPKGKVEYKIRPEIDVVISEDSKTVSVTRKNDSRDSRAYHGLTRALINNMVFGVKNGYEKKLEVVGVGYVCSVQGNKLSMRVGYANEIKKEIPSDLTVTCPDQTHIVVQGKDKQRVGQFAAEVRAVRKPEPYKGKGVRYDGEHVKIKPGKAAT
ncbi:MAG: 50S ribosomal protein L6 [Planctomycetota bacterium]|jgi:large subunit ribosomal protein L6|nr:50S ribosomal protein L6 [Planctomycetota bacterium]